MTSLILKLLPFPESHKLAPSLQRLKLLSIDSLIKRVLIIQRI
jgi:hypothetical protein